MTQWKLLANPRPRVSPVWSYLTETSLPNDWHRNLFLIIAPSIASLNSITRGSKKWVVLSTPALMAQMQQMRKGRPKPTTKSCDNYRVTTAKDSPIDADKNEVFAETGIVVMMCRHGHLHAYCDVYKGER